MYCGAILPVAKISALPSQRILESYEQAFNAIIEPATSKGLSQTARQFAEVMQIELLEAQLFLSATRPIPIARSQTCQEAELIVELARSFGLTAYVVADSDLKIGDELTRARKVTRVADQLQILHLNGEFRVAAADIKLMVLGGIKNVKTDFAEAAAGLGSKGGGVVDTAEFYSDAMLLDVYTADLESSFRIRADGFDYSSLVSPLFFRVELNFREVIKVLKGFAPQAIFDEGFPQVRSLLARAWPPRSHTESRGVKRSSMFKRVSLSTVASDNRDQFERYSRLMFLSAKK
jgi:hypothetical protein